MRSYRTLVAWQLSHRITILGLKGIDDAYQPRAHAVLQQLRRAIISIETNIVEGYALNTTPYQLKHYRIAFGSAAEAEILVYDAAELEYVPQSLAEALLPLIDECMKTLRGLMRKYGKE